MLGSILQHSTARRGDNFQGSNIIKGSWCSVVLGALKDVGININLLEVVPNNRKLKNCKFSEIMFYNGKRVMTLKSGMGLSANDVVKVFKKKGLAK